MTGNAMPEMRQPTLELPDEGIDHVRGPTAGRLIVEYGDYECPYSREVGGTPTLFIDGFVHRGGYDAATLMEALAR